MILPISFLETREMHRLQRQEMARRRQNRESCCGLIVDFLIAMAMLMVAVCVVAGMYESKRRIEASCPNAAPPVDTSPLSSVQPVGTPNPPAATETFAVACIDSLVAEMS